MKTTPWLAALALVVAAPCFADNPLVGTYKLVSFALEVDGVPGHGTMGPDPRGYLVITPNYYTHTYIGSGRKFGTSAEAKAALHDTLASVAGRYSVEGEQIAVTVEVAWNELWNGTRQLRHVAWSGNRLTLTSPPQPYPRDPGKTVVSRLVWEKVE